MAQRTPHRRAALLALIALGLATQSGCAARERFIKYVWGDHCAAGAPVPMTSFTRMVAPQIDPAEYAAELRAAAGDLEVVVIGRIEYQGRPHEIFGVHRPACAPGSAPRNAVVLAATHGNEVASALGALRLVRKLAAPPDPRSPLCAWNLTVITPLNPVGFAERSRYDEQGCDINRDFDEYRTLGARYARRYLQHLKPEVVISLHEGPQDGHFFYGPSLDDARRNRILEHLLRANVVLSRESVAGFALDPPGYMKVGGLETLGKHLLGVHSLEDLGRRDGFEVYTVESDWKVRDVNERARGHRVTVEAILANPPPRDDSL